MKRLIFAGIYFFTFSNFIFATGDDDYSILRISPALMKHANLVVRKYNYKVEIENLGKTRITRKYAITILNEAGEDYAQFVEHYDKLSSVKNMNGKLFDAFGKKIKELKKNEIKDVSNVSDISLFDDNRVKLHNFYYKVFPYTIEYESEVVMDGTMFIPPFFPLRGYFISVEQSSYQLICPESVKPVYRKMNFEKEPEITEAGKGQKMYSWQVNNLAALQKESLAPAFAKIAPHVLIALSEFEIEGYKGSNSSWKDFGKFIYELKKGRDELPPAVVQQVHQLADGESSVKEKVRKLYEYLQANTRYISIQLGVGGLRPFDAKYVAANRYGDCKALSNYMFSLLKEIKISSHYAVISAGDDEDDIVTDFTANQFNHVILCVPDGKDTIWLECTDQYKSPGYMGGFTGNRHALLVFEEGGLLVKTPFYSIEDNRQVRKINATLADDGTLSFKAATDYYAMQQDELQLYYTHLSKDKWKEQLQSRFDFSTYNINGFEYTGVKGKIPCLKEQLDISVSNYATITGKRVFIAPNIMTKNYRKYSADSTRKYALDMGFAFKDIDSVEIQLSPGYTQESMPQDVSISSKFANYKASAKVGNSKIIYHRVMEYKGGTFPASDYPELVKFYDAVYKADRNKMVFVKTDVAPKPF